MTTYSKVIDSRDLSDVPQIDRKDIKFIWYGNWWDGPIDGMLLYRNRKCWFDMFDKEESATWDNPSQRYLVIELTAEQIETEEYWHNLFVENVGSHMVPDENGVRHKDRVKPRETWHEFYEPYKNREQADFSNNLVLGFFEL